MKGCSIGLIWIYFLKGFIKTAISSHFLKLFVSGSSRGSTAKSVLRGRINRATKKLSKKKSFSTSRTEVFQDYSVLMQMDHYIITSSWPALAPFFLQEYCLKYNRIRFLRSASPNTGERRPDSRNSLPTLPHSSVGHLCWWDHQTEIFYIFVP